LWSGRGRMSPRGGIADDTHTLLYVDHLRYRYEHSRRFRHEASMSREVFTFDGWTLGVILALVFVAGMVASWWLL
jgi:hypothetical protein